MRTTWLALPLVTLAACAPEAIETRIVIREPQDVSLEVARRTVLPPGATDDAVVLDEGRLPTGETTSSDYRVTAIREAGGDIQLRWDTRLALVGGELQRLTPADGTFVFKAPAERVLSSGPELRLEQCAMLSAKYQRVTARGPFEKSGYETMTYTRLDEQEPTCAEEPGRVRYTLATPWRNVAEITETHTPITKEIAWAMLPFSAAEVGVGAYLLARQHGSLAGRVGGGALTVVGLAIQLPLASSMFARTRVRHIPVPRVVPYDD